MLSKFNPNRVKVFDLYDYAHLDYIWGKNAHKDIYNPIVKILSSRAPKNYLNPQNIKT